jgi:hypothetical protein
MAGSDPKGPPLTEKKINATKPHNDTGLSLKSERILLERLLAGLYVDLQQSSEDVV